MRCLILTTLLAGVTATALAQTIPTFTDATATRLVAAAAVGASDTADKRYGVGDLDGDGLPDVVVARRARVGGANAENPLANTLLMNENGVLTDRTALYAPDLLTARNTRFALVRDLNGDGLLDVFLADGLISGTVTPVLLLNAGHTGPVWNGLVAAPASVFPLGLAFDAWILAAGDLRGDGDIFPDIFVGNRNGDDMILINQGGSPLWNGFTNETVARLGANAVTSAVRSAEIVDINLDGDMDIIEGVTSPTGAIRYLKNDGTGVFTAVPQTINSGSAYNFALGDINRDGRKDFFVVKNGTDQYVINTGNGANDTITLAAAVNVPNTNGFGAACIVADLNGDHYDDFLVCDLDREFTTDCARRLRIYFGNSGGTLTEGYAVQQAWTPNGTSDVALIDLDGDGDRDMLVGFCTGQRVFMQVGAPCPADLSGDGQIGQSDLGILLANFGCTGVLGNCTGDINRDGAVNQADLGILLAQFGQACP